MNDPIEEMKKAGWEKDPIQGIQDMVYDYEYVTFRRLKPKPNAVVDLEEFRLLKTSLTRAYLHSKNETKDQILQICLEVLPEIIQKVES